MSAKRLLSIFQNKRLRRLGGFAANALLILALVYAALLAEGREISFVYANF